MAKVFISYRRAVSADMAASLGRILRDHDKLRGISFFVDQAKIRIGENFADRLEGELKSADILLALIGKGWRQSLDDREGERTDWVREELQAAHAQPNTTIIVVPHGAADLDSAFADLGDLAWLREVHRAPLGISDDHADLAYTKLIDAIRQVITDPINDSRVGSFRDGAWNDICESIESKRCIPIFGPSLGTNAQHGEGPNRLTLAELGAHGSPYEMLGDDLPRVAQAYAIEHRDGVNEEFSSWGKRQATSGIESDHPYAILGGQSLPLYLTVNFDTLLDQYLRENAPNEPSVTRSYSTLTQSLDFDRADLSSDGYPVVVHLLGSYEEPDSMVLTEDELLQLFISMSNSSTSEPFFSPLGDMLIDCTLLFIGFQLSDWRFRLLVSGLLAAIHQPKLPMFAVIDPSDPALTEVTNAGVGFVNNYLSRDNIAANRFKAKVHLENAWGFASELKRRLDERKSTQIQ